MSSSLRWMGVATAAWGVVFSVVRLYWAAGGSVGTDGDTPSVAVSLYIAFIAVLGLLGAAVAHGLYQPWGARVVGHRRLALLARIGGVALLLGVGVGVSQWTTKSSLEGDGVAGIVITAYFLLGGLLFSMLGWRRRFAPGTRA